MFPFAVGTVRMLHTPGELFVEYQLAAKAMRPDLHVAMAAYGDYGPATSARRPPIAKEDMKRAPKPATWPRKRNKC